MISLVPIYTSCNIDFIKQNMDNKYPSYLFNNNRSHLILFLF